jgi:hypothetical protein
VVAVDAPVEREEEEAEAEEPSAAVGLVLSIPMMSYSFGAPLVSLAAFLARFGFLACVLASVLPAAASAACDSNRR